MEKGEKERLTALHDSQNEPDMNRADEGMRRRETERHERDILMTLSMDARKTIPELVKITGIKETAVAYHLRNLERRYGIEYVLEIDIERFGYIDYVAFGKFIDKKPAVKQMKEELERYPYVQAAVSFIPVIFTSSGMVFLASMLRAISMSRSCLSVSLLRMPSSALFRVPSRSDTFSLKNVLVYSSTFDVLTCAPCMFVGLCAGSVALLLSLVCLFVVISTIPLLYIFLFFSIIL